MANELTYQSEFTGQQMDARFTAVAQLQEALAALETTVAAKYVKPSTGIPETDLDAAVQAALAKARSAVQDLSDYYTKTEIDALLAAVNSQQYVDVATLPTASASTLGKIYLVGPDTNNQYARYYTSYDGSAYSWVAAGSTEINLANYATKDELNQLEQNVDGLEDILDISSISAPITSDGSVVSMVIDSYGEISSLSATSYIIVYVQVTKNTKIRIQHSINGPSSGVGIYGYVNSVEDIVVGTFIQGKGGTRTTSGSYDETIDVPAGKVFVLSTQTSKCTYTLTEISETSKLVERVTSLEEKSTTFNENLFKKYPRRGVNLIESSAIKVGYYVNASGEFTTGTGWCAFEVKFIGGGVPIYLHGIYAGYYAIFDKNGNILENRATSDRNLFNGYILPTGAAYGRFSANYSSKSDIEENCSISYIHGLTYAEKDNRVSYAESFTYDKKIAPTEYAGRDFSTFRKIVCIGDSLTEGVFNHNTVPGETFDYHDGVYSYPSFLAGISGRTVVNLGDGGLSADEWYDTYKDSEELTGIDCAIIMLGVNDTASTLDTVSATAFQNIVSKLKANNTGIKIFLCSILNAKSYKSTWPDESYYVKDQFLRTLYADNWENDNDVFFLDLTTYGHLRDLYSPGSAGAESGLDNYNNGHLSAYGYNRLAQDIYAYCGYIMHNDATNFRKIMFIGSDFDFNF